MKTLCFALILAQNANENAAPPAHIQDLLKKRILYQIKQQNLDTQFFFDDPTCNVVGSYQYINEALQISSSDKTMNLEFSYNDILEGKKLDLSQISQSIETRQNIVAAALSSNSFDANAPVSSDTSGSTLKKWLPWVVGAAALSLGGIAVYSSMDKGGGSGGNNVRIRRR